jgi:hypothetical protein
MLYKGKKDWAAASSGAGIASFQTQTGARKGWLDDASVPILIFLSGEPGNTQGEGAQDSLLGVVKKHEGYMLRLPRMRCLSLPRRRLKR